MANFVNVPPLLNREQSGAMPDMIGKLFGGYNQAIQSKYYPKMQEAEIFHKQISPLAMLASSPYFSSLHPEQQQQIAGYISQMLMRAGMGGQAQNGPSASMGMGVGGMPATQGQPQVGGSNSLVPQNTGEHFTDKFGQSAYSSGVPHRGAQGETIYTPTGSNVQKGIDVLTESKGLKKLFDKYAQVAPDIGGAGGFKRDISNVASGIQKTGLPFSQKISEVLGGSELSNKGANADALRAQMAPALRAIGFSNAEISDILRFYPGETSQNIAQRLKNTWPVIERKIKQHQQNLNQGINVNNNVIGENDVPRSIGEKIARDEKERAQYGQSDESETNTGKMLLIAPNGAKGFVPTKKALELIKSGKFKEFK